MPRRSSRAVPASTTKRRASDRLSAQLAHAKKPKHSPTTAPAATTANPESVRTTAKRSKYFEQGEATDESRSRSNEEDASEDGFVSAAEDSPKDTASPTRESKEPNASAAEGKEQKKQKKSQGSKEEKGKKRDNPHPESDAGDEPIEPGKNAVASLKGKELWREGVKTGLGPGKEVFIQKPKARDPGDVPYEDHTLHPNTMLFLQDLEENNDRQWLKAHDPDFRAAKKDWETFVESLSEKIIDKDSTIPELPAKDLMFRIHRDVRFSKNPTPYKTHFSAAWSRTGKKGPYAAYYVHMQPGSCFVGSGLWSPEADALALLREGIDHNSSRLKAVLKEPAMRREIFNGMPDGDEEAVKAFVEQNKETALKIKPKGYDVDNENIQLLRLRSFTIGTPLSDSELLGPKVQERVAALIGIMEPFVTYLNSVVMPDPVSLEPSSGSESANESG